MSAKDFQDWWEKLTDAAHEGRNKDRAALAQLRRLDLRDYGDGPQPDIASALLIEQFRKLYKSLRPITPDQEADLVVCAHVLAHVRTDSKNPETAALLRGSDKEQPTMSEARFIRLMRAETSAELFEQARQLVALLKQEAPVGDLGDSLYHWRKGPAIRRNWARAYYGLDQFGFETPSDPKNSAKTQG